MKTLLGTLLLVLSLTASAQNTNGIVEGRVIRRSTGEPLSGVVVILRPGSDVLPTKNNRHQILTDAKGHFSFQNILPGPYVLLISKAGSVTRQVNVVVPTGSPSKSIEIALTGAATVHGVLRNAQGKPVQGMRVSLLFRYYSQGQSFLGTNVFGCSGCFVTTNDHGEYRLGGVAPGTYYLLAEYDLEGEGAIPSGPDGPIQAAKALRAGKERYVRTYYPGTSHENEAQPFTIAEGADVPMDLRIEQMSKVTISGSVSISAAGNGEGKRREGYIDYFMLVPRDGTKDFQVPNTVRAPDRSSDSSFELHGVLPGSYDMFPHAVIQNDPTRSIYTARVPIEVGTKDIRGLKILARPGMNVEGRIVLDRPGAIGNLAQFKVLVSTRDVPGNLVGIGHLNAVDSAGAFMLPNLQEASYFLQIGNLPPDAFISDIRGAASSSWETGTFSVGGTPTSALEVVVSTSGGTLEGTVDTSVRQSLETATIVLVPEQKYRRNFGLYKMARPDSNGHFLLRGIAPGTYKLFAWEDVPSEAYENTEYLRPYEAMGREIVVKAGTNPTTRVSLIPANP